VQQIADWLEKLGMSEYAQRFGLLDVPGVGVFCQILVRPGVAVKRVSRPGEFHRRPSASCSVAFERCSP
jgi:hypothetical protein